MTAAAFSADGSVLAVAAETVITLWDPENNVLVAVLGEIETVIFQIPSISTSIFLQKRILLFLIYSIFCMFESGKICLPLFLTSMYGAALHQQLIVEHVASLSNRGLMFGACFQHLKTTPVHVLHVNVIVALLMLVDLGVII